MMRKENYTVLLLVSIIYLFFNSFLLPEGLLYTTLLTPFFLVNLFRNKGYKVYIVFLMLTVMFAIVQLPTVEFQREYAKSFILLQTVAIFTINAYYVLRKEDRLAELFKSLGTANMLMLGVSLIVVFIPVLKPLMWYRMSMSEGLPIIPRLKMLTYEASYYSLILVPVFAYYLLRNTLLSARPGILLITLVLSMAMSLSFGVIIALMIAFFLLYFLNLNELGKRVNLNYFAAGIILVVIGIAAVYVLFPHNIVFDRMHNIFAGKDTSARGRTTESFVLAWDIAKMKSLWFGIGPGQLKLIGRDYIIQFYSYSAIPAAIRIPNAVAETLNIYGIVGVMVRFAIIFYLFIKTKVWNNYYRLLLFIFVFVYQFTGSFLFNIVEYVIWILAFSPVLFPVFDKKNFVADKAKLITS
jgi:hypothetical protein